MIGKPGGGLRLTAKKGDLVCVLEQEGGYHHHNKCVCVLRTKSGHDGN